MDWIPTYAGRGPRYLAIVDALEADIAAGRVQPGARLLPQRDLANRLDLSVGTVSKAYSEAERRGLISGEVGRGTFVMRSRLSRNGAQTARHVTNLALNVPPPTGAEGVIAATLAAAAADGGLADFLGYLPHQGLRGHRESIATWLAGHGIGVDADRVFITHGAQHAISICLGMLAGRGDTVLTEVLTYSGIFALAAHAGLHLHGVDMDEDGVIPAALDQALVATGARVFYAMPTLQTPTGRVMPEARRREIAAVIARREAWLVEDDAYGFLFADPPPPLSTLVPARGFYAMSFAKCLAPGLRIGAMVVPGAFRDRAVNAMRATGWMATPVMAEVVSRVIRNGDLARQVVRKRETAALRHAIARRALGARLRTDDATPGFHVWLPLPEGRTVSALIAQAAQAGITIAAPAALRPLDPASAGVRLCLGAPETEAELDQALTVIGGILAGAEVVSLV